MERYYTSKNENFTKIEIRKVLIIDALLDCNMWTQRDIRDYWKLMGEINLEYTKKLIKSGFKLRINSPPKKIWILTLEDLETLNINIREKQFMTH